MRQRVLSVVGSPLGGLFGEGAPWEGSRRLSAVGGVVAPVITVAPVLTWAVTIGSSPAVTPPTYTGSPGTITYTLKRDGAAVGGLTDVSEATIEAHVGVDADIGPNILVTATVTNGAGADSEDSNTVVFNDATYLPNVALGHTYAGAPNGHGITLADGDTTIDVWAATYGGDPLAIVLQALAATNRPAWSAAGGAGGRPQAVFDGSDNGLVDAAITKGSTWGQAELGYVGNVHTTGTGVDQIIGYGTGASIRFSITSSATANRCDMTTTGAGGVTSICTTAESATKRHWSLDTFDVLSGAAQIARVAGTIEDGPDVTAYAAYADGSAFWIGARSDAAAAAGVNIQAWYLSTTVLTADQRTHIRALLTYLTTVAC